jgi:hypothetical protein
MKKSLMFLIALTLTASVLLTTQPVGAFVCDSNTIQGNCVRYVRSVMTLPSIDLTFYTAKKSIINHRFPTVGSAAIMPAPGTNAQYGHIAVVRSVAIRSDGGLSLTIEESNWGDCAVTRRTVTPESRSIDGYFDPRYPSGQSNPRLDSVSPSSGTAGVQFPVTASGIGFEASSAQGMILGGWCDSFGKCSIPNNVMPSKSSTSLKIPVTLTSPGKYMLYIFNSASGKTSNGKPITIN